MLQNTKKHTKQNTTEQNRKKERTRRRRTKRRTRRREVALTAAILFPRDPFLYLRERRTVVMCIDKVLGCVRGVCIDKIFKQKKRKRERGGERESVCVCRVDSKRQKR